MLCVQTIEFCENLRKERKEKEGPQTPIHLLQPLADLIIELLVANIIAKWHESNPENMAKYYNHSAQRESMKSGMMWAISRH